MRALIFALALAACAAPAPPPADTPPGPDLQGTRWILASTAGAPPTQAPTLEFGDADRASGFSGCNQWFAQIDRAHGLRFSAIGMTRRACEAPAMEVERDFTSRLEATRDASVVGETLTLLGDNAQPIARFERVR